MFGGGKDIEYMSVRSRDAGSVNAVNGAGLMKSAVFWVSMLTASFLLGFLVIAPLAQLVRSRGETNPTPSVQQAANGRNASPSPSHAAVPHTQKRNVEPDEPVDIAPDKSQDGVSIQAGEDPTHAGANAEHPRRAEGTRERDENGTLHTDEGHSQPAAGAGVEHTGRTTEEGTGTERRARRGRTDRNETTGGEQTGAVIDDAGRATDATPAESTTHRRTRRSRTPGDTRTRDDRDVQRGEGIDR